ncbi:MAG: methylcobamide--CoM methyltransferase [Chloroflexi bacterium]|nr:methylcobamide--CoM methyltransferase [Chloroflexota bacterium]
MITTVVGNYPKIGPGTKAPNLRAAIARYDDGKITLEELHRVEDQVTIEVLEEQARAGVDMVTDGQVRWEDSQTYLARRLGGFSINGLIRYFDTNTYYRQPVVEGLVEWREPITVRDFLFAKEHSSRPVKPVLPGPYTLARLSHDRHYHNLDALTLALAVVLNSEAKELEKAGATIIQFDEPAILRHKGDFSLFQKAMEALARGLRAKLALYTYFGDVSGLVPLFFQLPFQAFGLDFVMGPKNYDLLAGFPASKELGLGIVDARNTRLEAAEELAGAVRRVSAVVPGERLYLNPSCGLEFLPRDTAYRKLARMVEGAKQAQEAVR